MSPINTYLRAAMILVILLGTIGLARNGVAWAQPGTKNDLSLQEQDGGFTPLLRGDDDGTVHPPPESIKVCRTGTFSVGGVSILKVKRLAPHYCLKASLWHEPLGTIPPGAGKTLADITLFQVIYKNHLVKSLPAKDGHVELCYAVLPGKQVKLYFLEKNVWKPMKTAVKEGLACARVETTGYYALIGK
jgi:hypothetical protein